MLRRGRPGLIGMAARTAVVAGTATAVSGNVQRRQQARANEQYQQEAYEAQTGVIVRETGFLALDDYMAGCSLDGDVQNFTGIVEFKCPKSATHISYIDGGKLPSKYEPQVTHNLWVTGAQWCDFASFDPRMPANLQLFVIRVLRANVDIDGYEKAALAFLSEVDALEQRLRRISA